MSRLLISAAHKSSGKTTLSIGLCAALTRQGMPIQAFKKGPDYIDPMWLQMASGRPCYNLDFYTQTNEEIDALVARHEPPHGLTLIEGNKGLFDGLDLEGSNSNAALARQLHTPVVLVIDTRGMTRGIAPLLMGYQAFDPQLNICGVILNQVGGSRHEEKLRAAVEHYTDIPVLGAVRRNPALRIDERHLGLVPSNEAGNAGEQINLIAHQVAEQVDLKMLLDQASPIISRVGSGDSTASPPAPSIRIAIARDSAFGFYYADDLEAFTACGAELVPFNAITDERLPEADGLFIGGGFPESCMEALQANQTLREDIRGKIEAGMPAYAECGGLMYLARCLEWKERRAAMVGVIPARVSMHRKPQGRGYIRIAATSDHPWLPAGQDTLCGHEFHHSRLTDLPADTRFAYRVLRGAGIDGEHDGVIYNNLLASYAHLRNTRHSPWVAAFVDFVRQVNFPA